MIDLRTRQLPALQPQATGRGDGASRVAVVLLALCVATVAVEVLPPLRAVRGPVVLGFWLLVPGGTIRTLARSHPPRRISPIDPALGLALLCLLSQTMLAFGQVPATAGTAAAALASLAVLAVAVARHTAGSDDRTQPASGSASRPAHRSDLLLVGLVVTALVLWLLSWRRVSPAQLGSWGILTALPATWYAALAILLGCAGYLAVAVRAGRTRGVLWAVAVVALVLVIHATPAILEGGPRYTWTYKHFGVIRYLMQFHRAPRGADIYFNWPGFFTAATWIQQTTGWSLAALARWAPPFFELLSALGVLRLSRALFRDVRIVRLSVVLYLVANWVGQDYFSPQAFAFFLALVFLSSFIKLVRTDGCSPDRRVASMTAVLTWFAVLTTHQLTPVMLLVSAALICVLMGRWPWRHLAVFAATEVGWVALAIPYLRHGKYPLLSFDPLSGSQQPVAAAAVRSVGYLARADAVRVLYYGLFLVSAAVLVRGLYQAVRQHRDPRRSPVFIAAVLAFGPTFVLLAQNYGGEGELRAYLFAVPLLAAVSAAALVSLRGRLRVLVRVVGVAVMSAAFLLAYYGQEQVNVVQAADVAATNWFYAHAPAGAAAVYLAPNAPTRLSARYVDFPMAADALPTVLDSPDFARSLSAEAATSFVQSLGRRGYLIVTPSEGRYLAYFGIMGPSRYQALIHSLNGDSRLQLVFSQGGSYVWESR